VDPTIERLVRTKAVTPEDLPQWAAYEAIPWMQEVKRLLDQVYVTARSLPTAGTGVFTTVWTSPDLAEGFDWMLEARIMAHASTARSSWIIEGLFYNDGTVQQAGATFAVYTQTTAAFDVQFLIVDNHIEVQVQDDGILSPQWQVWINLRENP